MMGVKLLSPTPADLPLTMSPASNLNLSQAPVFNFKLSCKPWGHGQPDPIRTVLNATAVLQPVLSPKQQWRRGGVLHADEAPCCTRDTRLLSFVPSHSFVLSRSRLQFSFSSISSSSLFIMSYSSAPKVPRSQDSKIQLHSILTLTLTLL